MGEPGNEIIHTVPIVYQAWMMNVPAVAIFLVAG